MGNVIVVIIWGTAAGAAVWFVRYVRSVLRGDWRQPEDADVPWWQPGQGGHGGDGGQVPPFVPYNPDWDPKNRRD